jgi:hypothetical protein
VAKSKQDEHPTKPALNADQHTQDGRHRLHCGVQQKEARIYNATTTIVSASKDPILVTPHCQDTGLWKLNLDYEVLGRKYPDQFIAGVGEANAIFDLPNTRQSLLYHHALAGFPPKETFLAAVRAENVGGICSSARIHPCFHDSVDWVRPAELVSWSNTFYYFRFLFVTRENYSGESQRKLAYQDLTLARLQRQYAITPLRHYAIMPLRQYASTPVCQYASMPVRQYASMPVRQYASMPVRQYASMPVRQYPSMPVCQYTSTPAV